MDPSAVVSVAPAAAAAPAEAVFFNEQGVFVSSARVVVEGQTYALRNITSVRARKDGPPILASIVVFVFGLFWMGVSEWSTLAVWAVGIPAVWFFRKHHVAIATAAGEQRALSSRDGSFVRRIVEAINSAIVHQAR